MKILKEIFVVPIKIYRKFISPLLPPSCRFYPSCSAYALEAVERFGIIKGSLLALFRILRCNPLCRGGIDYVPEKFPFPFKRKN